MSPVLALLANRDDTRAAALATRWAAWGAKVFSPDDLAQRGWVYHVSEVAASSAVVRGEVLPASSIRGVLVLLAEIGAAQLVHVEPGDREYVAAEMSAFLCAWLTALPCAVLNRPSPTSLGGPSWPPEQWLHEAARLDIPVRPLRRRTSDGAPPEPASARVVVAGRHCFGDVTGVWQQRALRLARAAKVELLTLHLDGVGPRAVMLGAEPRIEDLTSPEIADALLERLTEHVSC